MKTFFALLWIFAMTCAMFCCGAFVYFAAFVIKRWLLITLNIICLCASAQMIPPMVQPPVVVQKKQPHLNPIILSWPSSLAADLGSYLLEGLTNGVVFETTNTKSTSVLFSCWSGQTNAYRLYAISTNGIMAPIYASLTHSGWNQDCQYVLAISTNGVLYTNAYAVDSTNLSGPAFFRSGIGQDVLMQQSGDMKDWSNCYASDVDNFPSDFTAVAQVRSSIVNVQ